MKTNVHHRISSHLILIILLINLVLNTSNGYSQYPDAVLNLDELVQIALEKNPQLHSLYSAARADSAKIPQAGALPDPMLTLSMMNLPVNSFALDQEPMTGKQISLMQQFPFPGKLALKEEISSEQTTVSKTNYQEYRNEVIRDTRVGYYDLFLIDKSIEITKKNQQLLSEFAQIAEARYKVGKGQQQDVLKAQVELSIMIEKMIQLEQKREVQQAHLNTILNQPVNTPLGQPREPQFLQLNMNLDSLRILAESNRPLLKGWESMRRQSILNVDLAKKDYWPNFSIFLAYTQRDKLQSENPGYDFFSGGISLNIPLYSSSKQSRKVDESIHSKNTVDERFQHILNQVFFDIERLYSSLKKNVKLVELFQTGIIPQASQSLESALTGYQTDKVDFLTLVNNQITLFNYELEYYRVLSDYNKDMAGLEYATGTRLIY